jgi:NAD+ synthase (glutamine-hydrolysing)
MPRFQFDGLATIALAAALAKQGQAASEGTFSPPEKPLVLRLPLPARNRRFPVEMKIALAQINTTVGDFRGNCGKILDAYHRAVRAGAGLVVTPEMAVTGYPPRDLLAKRRFVEDNLQALDELAAQIGSTPLVVGYVEINLHRPGKDYFNAAAVARDGKIVDRRFKTLLPTYDVFDEDRYFQPADSNQPVDIGGQTIGLTICEDIWAQDYLPAHLYARSPIEELMKGPATASVLLNISASPYHLGKEQVRDDMLSGIARTHRTPVAYCNLVGGNDELIFDGNSMVFDAGGRLIARGAAFREDLVMVDVDSSISHEPSPIAHSSSPIASLHSALVLGLRDYTEKCGFKSVVLGLSGGVDSAVSACLAVDALGRENVMGVSMPSQFSSKGSIEDSRELARNLGIRWEIIPIQDVFEQYKATLKALFKGLREDTAEENIQARIRGTLLMALSNKLGHMLLTTGNKSELAVGYCTLYGDMNGGLGVIADVPKTTVYELARFINMSGKREGESGKGKAASGQRKVQRGRGEAGGKGFPIPEASLTKPPSAELRPNQTDQDTLPPYDMLDAILKRYVEESKSAAEIIQETGYDEKLIRDVVRKIDLNEYKRKQAPPCLRVTTKAFGIGRRVPIAQRYVER